MEGGFSIDNGIQALVPLASRIRGRVRRFLEGTRACDLFDVCCGLVEESPVLKLILFTVVLFSVVPISVFITFAILSLITTFTGFLLLEGALLVITACAAILWLGAVGVYFFITATIAIIFNLVIKHGGDIFKKIETFYLTPSSESVEEDMVVVDTNHED